MDTKKIDLIDTFNYLLGIHVKKILTFDDKATRYKVVTGEKESVSYIIIWRTTTSLLNLESDKKYIEEIILPKNKAEKILINSDFYVESEAIEPLFQTLMGA